MAAESVAAASLCNFSGNNGSSSSRPLRRFFLSPATSLRRRSLTSSFFGTQRLTTNISTSHFQKRNLSVFAMAAGPEGLFYTNELSEF